MTLKSDATCRACGAPMAFARTAGDKAIPLDVEPVADGNLVVSLPGAAALRARAFEPLIDRGQSRYRSHFASCPQAAEFRKPNGKRRPGKARA